MKGIIISKVVNVIFFYFFMIGYDWYIEHNELEIKKVRPNKYITPISFNIARRKGKYVKLELFYIITEIYAHFILLLNVLSLILINTEHFEQLSKYLFIGSLIVFFIILVVCKIISTIKRKR